MRAPRPTPPEPPRRPEILTAHGDTRVDYWYWLRDRDDPAVRAHLEAENAYTEGVLAPSAALRERLFTEIAGRVQQTDVSAPVPHGPFEYYSRTVEGLQYAIRCRRPRGGGDEQVLLDENVLAEGHGFFELGGFEPAPDHRVLAYSLDTTGGERHTLRYRDLESGTDLPDLVPDTYYGLAWADDVRTILYVRPDDAMRPWQVWRHALGTAATDDCLVFQEDDDRFFVSVSRTLSGRFLVIESRSKMTSEAWLVPSATPDAAPRVVAPREQGVEYSVDHHPGSGDEDRLFVLTNADGAENFRLAVTPVATPGRDHWSEVVVHRADVRLEEVTILVGHLVLSERADGLPRLRAMRLADGDMHTIDMPDPVYGVWVGANEEFDTSTLRYGYSSLVQPPTDYDYDLDARTSTLVKRQPVLGGYDPQRYVSAREWAIAADGTRVPISIVHPRGMNLDGTAPALLYGYGSYEATVDAVFRSARLSLLERGFVFAIAHVRGGGEMGRHWYEDGRLGHKRNTFTDFVACAEHLVARGYTAPDRLVARGGSAGGLLVGTVANLRPDLFAAIVAEVPFVDVLTTMRDPSIPLTVTEWEEWGNPADPSMYEYLKSYSPYDNVGPHDYPHLLVTTGFNDPRVQYWEPAKWVLKLRATQTGSRRVLLKVEMGAGHGGPSGRYEAWRQEAFVLAFVLDCLGIRD